VADRILLVTGNSYVMAYLYLKSMLGHKMNVTFYRGLTKIKVADLNL